MHRRVGRRTPSYPEDSRRLCSAPRSPVSVPVDRILPAATQMMMGGSFGIGGSSPGEYVVGGSSVGGSGGSRLSAWSSVAAAQNGAVDSGFSFPARFGGDGSGGGEGVWRWPQPDGGLLPGSQFSAGYFPWETSTNAESHISSTFPITNNAMASGGINNLHPSTCFANQNATISNSSPNVNRWLDVLGNLSTSCPLQSQLQLMHHPASANNFYPQLGAVCERPSTIPSPITQQTLSPAYPSSSCTGYVNPVMEAHNQQELMSNWSHNSFQSEDRNTDLNILTQKTRVPSSREKQDKERKIFGLVKLVQKDLTNSDVGSIGRIVLPKKEAEANLPQLAEKAGMILQMDDLKLPVTWKFKYRYWPNNKSRMYVLETTGNFVRTHGLQVGDCLIIYKNIEVGNYVSILKSYTSSKVVTAEKEIHTPVPAAVNEVSRNCTNEDGVHELCNDQVVEGKEERGAKRQCSEEQSVGCDSDSSITKAEEEFFLNLLNTFSARKAGSPSQYAGPSPDANL